jgi:hypothetical protein
MVYLKRKLWELEWYSDLEAPRHPRASNPWLKMTNQSQQPLTPRKHPSWPSPTRLARHPLLNE